MRVLVKLTFDDHITQIQQESENTHMHNNSQKKHSIQESKHMQTHPWHSYTTLCPYHIRYVIIIVVFFPSAAAVASRNLERDLI